jgi:23S rRNA (guanine745-N1)-methyltransferase
VDGKNPFVAAVMKVSPLLPMTCPMACSSEDIVLVKEGRSHKCSNGHLFDIAKEGYCNLLPVHQKASLNPGDSNEMVQARRRFLDAGYFKEIAQQVCSILGSFNRSTFSVLDAGCGEGYYLNAIADWAKTKESIEQSIEQEIRLAGIDVSKWAVRAAAKRTTEVNWLVASNKRIPFVKNSIDVILCMFGFPQWKEFYEHQPDEGSLLLVDPGPDHLIELRRIIYPVVQDAKAGTGIPAEGVGYHLVYEKLIQFEMNVESLPLLQDLLAMTPHAYRITSEGRVALSHYQELKVTAQVKFRLFSRGLLEGKVEL